jgi:7-cyano-7-deazaguanine synthase
MQMHGMPAALRKTSRLPGLSALPCTSSITVLLSGGLDSAILLGECLMRFAAVHPLYVRCGLRWEREELAHVRRFLAALRTLGLGPLHVLDQPAADLYGDHWSLEGEGVPDLESPDEAVFLPGRNVLLLTKAMLWCHLRGIPAVALASLSSNPFPDATLDFMHGFEQSVNRAVRGEVRIVRPYARLDKAAVMRRGRHLPLELTFSCLKPVAGSHCGRCNKCAERRAAFAAADLPDRTTYGS